MQWRDHSRTVKGHSLLSPSRYHWVNYTDEQFDIFLTNSEAARRGTELHALAEKLIRLGVRLPRTKSTLNTYVNDAIGFKMEAEKILYYSEHAFGTADAISFRKNKLRIHDLKTGVTPGSPHQLDIYMSLFCLEYGFNPKEIDYELRIYQNDEVLVHIPEPDDILFVMGRIIYLDKRINDQTEL